MLGAAKTSLLTSTITPADYSVFVSPGILPVLSSNGSSTSPKAAANVIGGIGPFEYLWVVDNSEITINSPTEEKTSFTASGYNTEIEGVATVTVTDTGNTNEEKESTVNLFFIFGIVQ